MAATKRTRSRSRSKAFPFPESIKFPQATGKTVAEVRLRPFADEFSIAIDFDDRSSLHFGIEPGVRVAPVFGTSNKAGNWKRLKVWRPIHSPSSRV